MGKALAAATSHHEARWENSTRLGFRMCCGWSATQPRSGLFVCFGLAPVVRGGYHRSMNKTEYRKALRTGNLDAIVAGLDSGIDVNWQIEKGETALHKAVTTGQLDVVRLLLTRNANVNLVDSAMKTPLDIAGEKNETEIASLLKSHGGETFETITKKRESEIREQSWASGFSWRTVKALVQDGVTTEEKFLHYQGFSRHSLSVWKEAEERQRDLKIQKGLLDPKEPLNEEEVLKLIEFGGLFFRGETPLFSLGTRNTPQGKFICVSKGHIYFEYKENSYGKDTAFRTIHCWLMSKIGRQYGVNRRAGFDQWEHDVELTRKVFRLDIESLENVVRIYHLTFRYDYSGSGYLHRVTCSDQDNSCDITGNYIPAGFPFIAFGDTQYWLGHISLGGFLETLRFLTDNMDERCKATQLLIANGLTAELLNLLRNAQLNDGEHVRFNDVHRSD